MLPVHAELIEFVNNRKLLTEFQVSAGSDELDVRYTRTSGDSKYYLRWTSSFGKLEKMKGLIRSELFFVGDYSAKVDKM